ncbi:hypothetical protein DL96DRAFT_1707731 [Flagelloscypha sp. PMI_526]|nr:hypothetical protein DL96DRAFT_1707731 [Flagelloscypha sp. PMI_526]
MASPPSLVTIAGPPLLGFFFNLILSGVLIVQDLYYIGFPNDLVRIKALVYAVFVLEMLQTGIQCYDKFNLYGKEFGDVANLDKGRLSWFSIAVLTSFTGGIVQAFLGWKIYTLSKNIYIAIGVWILTLLATGAGIAQGVLVKGVLVSQVATHIQASLNIWFITTAVNDFIIAGILTFYLHRMKSGIKQTDKLVTRIIMLTVETGSITALSAVIIVVTFFVKPPWFLVIAIGKSSKLYANNMMVMFNRRLTVAHHPSSSEITFMSNTQLDVLKTNPAHTTSVDMDLRFSSMGTIKPRTGLVSSPSEWDNSPATGYAAFESTKGPETQRW